MINSAQYMLLCCLLDVIIGFADLYFKWFPMEFVSMGFIALLAMPLLIKPFGIRVGLSSGILWK